MNQIFFILGNSSFFAMRAFLPPLMMILSFRFPQYFPVLDSGIAVPGDSSWFFSDASLYTFGVLAVFEILASKSSTIRPYFDPFMSKVKLGLGFVVNLHLLSPDTAGVLTHVQTAGFSAGQMIALIPTIGTYYITQLRNGIYEFLEDFDDDDDLKIQLVFSFFEDFSVMIGVVLLIVIPVLVVSITGIIILIIWFLQKHFSKIEESKKINCLSCHSLILPTATECYSCHIAIDKPMALGLFGQIKDTPTEAPEKQKMRLLGARRCPHCAEKLKKSKSNQTCSKCGYQLRPPIFKELIQSKQKELFKGLLITTVVGFIPILGMIFAILYSRMIFVKPFKQYTPKGKAGCAKMILRILGLLLTAFQSIPFFGAILAPLLLLMNYSVYKSLLEKELNNSLDSENIDSEAREE